MFNYDNRLEEGTIECDGCGDEDTFSGSFKECISHFKSEGWLIVKNENWEHYCPDCKTEI